jgi:WD40 repeat protein
VLAIAFDPFGRRCAAGGDDRRVVTWETENWQEIGTWPEIHEGPIRGVAFSPDGSILATASNDQTVQLRDANSGRLMKTLKLEQEDNTTASPYSSVAFHPGGRQVVAACASGTAVVWDTRSGAVVHKLGGHVGQVFDARFSPDGRRVLTAGDDHTVKLWDAVLGTETFELRRDDRVAAIAMTPDGFQLLAACWDGTVTVWDATPIVHIPGRGAILADH